MRSDQPRYSEAEISAAFPGPTNRELSSKGKSPGSKTSIKRAPAKPLAPIGPRAPAGPLPMTLGGAIDHSAPMTLGRAWSLDRLHMICDNLAATPDGSRHFGILEDVQAIGGFIESGCIDEITAMREIERAVVGWTNPIKTMETICDAIEYGRRSPIFPHGYEEIEKLEPFRRMVLAVFANKRLQREEDAKLLKWAGSTCRRASRKLYFMRDHAETPELRRHYEGLIWGASRLTETSGCGN
jgi:hypothetical protein